MCVQKSLGLFTITLLFVGLRVETRAFFEFTAKAKLNAMTVDSKVGQFHSFQFEHFQLGRILKSTNSQVDDFLFCSHSNMKMKMNFTLKWNCNLKTKF